MVLLRLSYLLDWLNNAIYQINIIDIKDNKDF